MEEKIERGGEYTLYVFDDQEFKEKLGITDQRDILTVDVSFSNHEISVRMAP